MSIGRPLEFDPEQALDAALAVFWSQGYEATSLQDLLQAMGLSKSSFYQAFSSKRALFERCLDRYRDRFAGDLWERLGQATSAVGFIEEVLHSIAFEARGDRPPRGCLVMNTANEFSQSDTTLARRVASGIASFRKVFEAAVRRAQQEGVVSQEHDAETLANYLVTSIAGLRTMVKAGVDARTVESVIYLTLKGLR